MSEEPSYVIGPRSDRAYDLMMVSHGKVVSIFESQGMPPCTAIKLAHEVMDEAFEVWGMFVKETHEYEFNYTNDV